MCLDCCLVISVFLKVASAIVCDLDVLVACKEQIGCVLCRYWLGFLSLSFSYHDWLLFDRIDVAFEENQLDWRTDRCFGQRGEYRLSHFTKKS